MFLIDTLQLSEIECKKMHDLWRIYLYKGADNKEENWLNVIWSDGTKGIAANDHVQIILD